VADRESSLGEKEDAAAPEGHPTSLHVAAAVDLVLRGGRPTFLHVAASGDLALRIPVARIALPKGEAVDRDGWSVGRLPRR
jgi:hypothetical protein